MSHEIEFKAHIDEKIANQIKDKISNNKDIIYLGEIDKKDIYWKNQNDKSALFRTRYEINNDKSVILFTSKPTKSNDNLIECNEEVEFSTSSDNWDKVLDFCKSINLAIARIKYKKGFHFIQKINEFDIHCEVLNVKYLGWFFECEIVSDAFNEYLVDNAKNSLLTVLKYYNIPESSIEIKGYNKLLQEVGHELG